MLTSESEEGAKPNLRAAERFALLMLRSAKLVADGVEYLCIVRDVSAKGVKLRLFHPLPPARSFLLETAGGERIEMQLVWEGGGHAGFRFASSIDVPRFVEERSDYPKRPVRLRVHHPALLLSAGLAIDATMLDISRQGACIHSSMKLAIGQKMRLEARELPSFDATVCWRRAPTYGVVFTELMTPGELAQRATRMARSELEAQALAS